MAVLINAVSGVNGIGIAMEAELCFEASSCKEVIMFVSCVILSSIVCPAEPSVMITGAASRIEEFKIARINSKLDFEKIWSAHCGVNQNQYDLERTPILRVNFDTHEVVAIFVGETGASDSILSASIFCIFGQTVVVYEKSKYMNLNRLISFHPFGFIVFPKSSNRVRVVERVRDSFPNKSIRYIDRSDALGGK